MLKPSLSKFREANGLVFVSGQMAFDAEMRIVGDDVAAQTRTCLDNAARILEEAGLSLKDVVKTTVWLARTEDFAAFNSCYAAYFPDTLPARSTVRADLMVSEALVEIEVVAARAS